MLGQSNDIDESSMSISFFAVGRSTSHLLIAAFDSVLLSGFVLGAAAGYRKNLVAYQLMSFKNNLKSSIVLNDDYSTVPKSGLEQS